MPTKQDPQLKIRLPLRVKDWIEAEAKANERSQSAEIALRLDRMRVAEQLSKPA